MATIRRLDPSARDRHARDAQAPHGAEPVLGTSRHRDERVRPAPLAHDHEVLTVADIARWLRISRNTVYDMVAQHQLPHFRVGNSIRFRRDAIVEWMRRQQNGGPDVW